MLNRILSNKITVISIVAVVCLLNTLSVNGQLNWTNVSDQYGVLPASVSVFKTQDKIDGRPNIAFYVEIDTRDKNLSFEVDTTLYRRLTPQQFYDRNKAPYIVMNCSFFEFKQNRNVNLIVQDGKMVAFDTPAVSRKGKDTLTFMHTLGSAFGMNKKREMDIVYNFNDSSFKFPFSQSEPLKPLIDSFQSINLRNPALNALKPWKVNWAFGGGPVLILNNQIRITNNEERKFAGKAINDLHPRTAIGFTADNKMILLVVQGRMPGIAGGASLNDLAEIMLKLNCIKAMNLDGGGSSTLLVNGKETIKPSDSSGQRPVPAVLVIGDGTKKRRM
jgi:exopolysaccharide biosynthesis protein